MQCAQYILLSSLGVFAASERSVPDEICGPRSVHSVLTLYGHEDSLLQLVTEIQPAGSESSLHSLAHALSARGISSHALRIKSTSAVILSRPAIMHVTGADGRGHFIALEPTSSRGVFVIWDGLNGTYLATAQELDALSPDVILFTSKDGDEPQEENIEAINHRIAIRWTLFACVPFVVAAAVSVRHLARRWIVLFS